MKIILAIIKKELTEITRDKKVLVSTILVPLVMFPLMFGVFSKAKDFFENKDKKQKVYIGNLSSVDSIKRDLESSNFEIVKDVDVLKIDSLIKNETLDAALISSKNYRELLENKKTATIYFHYNSSNITIREKVSSIVENYRKILVKERLTKLNLDRQAIEPMVLIERDLSLLDKDLQRQKIGEMIGGFLPYMIFMLGFIGCIYTAVDSFAGEKEKKTIETLLTFPVSRIKILIAKLSVITISGFISILASFMGLAISFFMMEGSEINIFSSFLNISVLDFVMFFALVIPLIMLFAAMLSIASIYSSSYKEATSIAGQLSFVVVIPAAFAMIPGVELSYKTAFVPILNVALAIKEILSGTIDYKLYFLTFFTLIAFATALIFVSKNRFESESSLLS